MIEVDVLKWLHILAMVYWLGGEWGHLQSSYKGADYRLSAKERARHQDTAAKIDILAQIGLISLLPLGLHLGHYIGIQPYGENWLIAIWVFYGIWLALILGGFFYRGSELGKNFNKYETRARYLVIPILIISAVTSFMGMGPFLAGPGEKWFSAKILSLGILLITGIALRQIMLEWQPLVAKLAKEPDEDSQARLESLIMIGRSVAYAYWIGIAVLAFFGTVKPF